MAVQDDAEATSDHQEVRRGPGGGELDTAGARVRDASRGRPGATGLRPEGLSGPGQPGAHRAGLAAGDHQGRDLDTR